ncbi:MAG: histidine kinase, partial [Bacteroidota bacterium]
YQQALKNYFASLTIHEEIKNRNGIAVTYSNIGNIFVKEKNFSDAQKYLSNALSISKELGDKELMKGSYLYQQSLDSAMNNFQKAYENLKLFYTYRDSLINQENTKKIVQTQMQYDFDKKETATKAETDKKELLAKAEISKQKIIRNSIAGGTGILVLSSIFSFLFYKRKREASFKNEVSEVEMKALRSQMNPHFIFNSLNSIKRYMANHDNKTAEDYLTKFASVMRMILENSEHKEVPLQQDLKALELYMQLESLRMKKKFNYEIKIDENIDQENTLIPPLILQPFVENSIWHGLAEKEGEGKITNSISKSGEMIECCVEDDGVGRVKSNASKPGYAQVEKKSLGMKITNARIDILNKIKKTKAGVELVDLAEGMKVIVRLPLELNF